MESRVATVSVSTLSDEAKVTVVTGLELAQLHSLAVDYAKTGYPAKMKDEHKVRRWPHFMEKRNKGPNQVYYSEKILGQLYDDVERVDFVPHYTAHFDDRVLKVHQPDEALIKLAKGVKKEYDSAIRRIMAQHSIGTEFEVWSTFVLSHNSRTRDYKFHEEIGQLSQSLKDTYRAHCIKTAGGKDFHLLGPFVVAMYVTTQDEIGEAFGEVQSNRVENPFLAGRPLTLTNMPLMTFPWIFPEIMGRIAQHRGGPLKVPSMKPSPAINQSPKPINWLSKEKSSQLNPVDDIVTLSGVTHRGEVLELFTDSHLEKRDVSNQQLLGDGQGNSKVESSPEDSKDPGRPSPTELDRRGVENQPLASSALYTNGATRTRKSKTVIEEEIGEDTEGIHPAYAALEKLSLRR
jgi:RNA-dependent RNA polymerase